MLFGAAGRIRTADLILTKDALYRLSYSRESVPGGELFEQAMTWESSKASRENPGGYSNNHVVGNL